LAAISRQDAWISAALGGIYPLYVVVLTIFISRRFPDEDILSVSKKLFGKFIGSALNLMFSAQLFVNLIGVASGDVSLSRIYMVSYLSVLKISIVILIIAAYGNYLGLKVIGRISELMYYLTVLLLTIPLVASKDGTILNVSPVLGSGIKNIFKASIQSTFSYSGIEIILLIYPYMKDKKNFKGAALKGALITVLIYTYLTFATIYFAGPYLILRSYYPVMLLTETINLRFLNSFRFIVMFIWIMIVFKTLINNYYGFTYAISNSIVKLSTKRIGVILYPIILFVVNSIQSESARRAFVSSTIYYTTAFNIIFITLIAIIIYFKKGEKHENL
jgi:spore germination protein (amino acid permease)